MVSMVVFYKNEFINDILLSGLSMTDFKKWKFHVFNYFFCTFFMGYKG